VIKNRQLLRQMAQDGGCKGKNSHPHPTTGGHFAAIFPKSSKSGRVSTWPELLVQAGSTLELGPGTSSNAGPCARMTGDG